VRVSNFFRVPKVEDDPRCHRAWGLRIILATVMVFVTVMMAFDIHVLPQNTARWVAVIVFINSICPFLLYLNHRGRTQAASLGAVISFWVMVTVLIASENTLRAPGAPAYLLIIFTAGLLLGARAGVLTAIVCGLTITAFMVLEPYGYFQKSAVRHTAFVYWFTEVFFMFMILSLQWLANRSVTSALKRAQQELEERKRAEEVVQESEELYRIVVEQTGQMVYDYDIPSGKIKWQGAITQLTGFPAEEFGAVDVQRWTEMIHE
jgi:PAS domain-containing protein